MQRTIFDDLTHTLGNTSSRRKTIKTLFGVAFTSAFSWSGVGCSPKEDPAPEDPKIAVAETASAKLNALQTEAQLKPDVIRYQEVILGNNATLFDKKGVEVTLDGKVFGTTFLWHYKLTTENKYDIYLLYSVNDKSDGSVRAIIVVEEDVTYDIWLENDGQPYLTRATVGLGKKGGRIAHPDPPNESYQVIALKSQIGLQDQSMNSGTLRKAANDCSVCYNKWEPLDALNQQVSNLSRMVLIGYIGAAGIAEGVGAGVVAKVGDGTIGFIFDHYILKQESIDIKRKCAVQCNYPPCALCASGVACISNRCIDTNNDPFNCGREGFMCRIQGLIPSYKTKLQISGCVDGVCKCNGKDTDDLVCCNDGAWNTKTDRKNCGRCGKACPSHLVCRDGKCQCSNPNAKDCGNGCCSGLTNSAIINCCSPSNEKFGGCCFGEKNSCYKCKDSYICWIFANPPSYC